MKRNVIIISFPDRVVLALLGLYFVLTPFYFWRSGIPQISDFVMVLALVIYIIGNNYGVWFSKETRNFSIINCLFVSYIFIVNGIWDVVYHGEIGFFQVSMFYLYNSVTCLMIVSLCFKYRAHVFKVIFYAVLLSVFLQVLLVPTIGARVGIRTIGFFNNPNQLGYYSLLSCALLLFMSDRLRVNHWLLVLGVLSSTLLCLLSLSSGAILAFFGMLFYFVLLHKKDRKFQKKVWTFLLILLAATSVLGSMYVGTITSSVLYRNVFFRLSTMGQSADDSLAGRFYNRLGYPEYWAFGAGEGAYFRFGSGVEFHSTLGNLQVSYGIVGLGMFLALLYIAMKRSRWQAAYLVFWILFYGLTHNGIRSTFLWIIIGLAASGIPNIKRVCS